MNWVAWDWDTITLVAQAVAFVAVLMIVLPAAVIITQRGTSEDDT